jgi:hypothetical protein
MSLGPSGVPGRPAPQTRSPRTRSTSGPPAETVRTARPALRPVDRRRSHPASPGRKRPKPTAEPARGAEGLGALSLIGVAATHLLDLGNKLEEAPYMGALFIVLIGGSIVAAVILLGGRRAPVAWRVGVTLSVVAMLGYLLSRSVGLPQLGDHVGHWADPAGIAALTFEAVIVLLATGAVARGPDHRIVPAAFSLALGLLGVAAVGAGGAGHSHGAGSPGEAQSAAGVRAAVAHSHAGQDHGHGHPVGRQSQPGVLAAHGHGTHGDAEQYPDLAQATADQRAEARRLWLNSKRCAAETGVGTVAGARAQGYRVSSRTGLWHLTNRRFSADDVILDASRPAWNGGDADGCRIESLVYANPMKASDCRGCRLVAAMYRLPTAQVPELGGPIVRWHAHETGSGLPMTHVWFTNDLRSAYALKAPRELGIR